MKTLFVIRHAKSSWDITGRPDFERTLNDRGEKDAPKMAARLWEKGFRLDAVVSSPAVRALTTAQFFAGQFGFKKKEIVLVDRLYHAPSDVFYDVVSNELKDAWEQVALFSHNPGITHFVNTLGLVQLDNMPTCGIFGVKADIKHWKDFESARKEFVHFDYPKNVG